MHRVTWAFVPAADPMGQQCYEREIQAAMRRVAGPDWSFEVVEVTPMRSTLRGSKRISMRFNTAAPLPVSRLAGRVLYGRPDIVHRFDLRLPSPMSREVVTLHDLAPLRFPDEGRLTSRLLLRARRATRVIVPSRFAAEELSKLAGIDDVAIIPNGVSSEYVDAVAVSDSELDALGVETPFVMHAAGATQRKNLDGLADAWRRISADHPELSLVLCGTSDRRRDATFEGLPRVVKTGRLRTAAVAGLMRRAAALVVPSTYEGFGLPALEGMVCGAPVIAARRGALPEVCGDAALLVEPDGGSIAEGLERVLTDAALADRLRTRGHAWAARFSWDAAAKAHLRVYLSALL